MVAAPIPIRNWRDKLRQGKQGPVKCMTNILLYLENLPELKGRFRLNELSGDVDIDGVAIQDHDYVDVRVIMELDGYIPDKTDISAAIQRVARDHVYHPVRDYLTSLEWDGAARLDGWLIDQLGAPDHQLIRSFGAKFLIGSVARVMKPGCKMDNVLVWEGPQGIGKSTAISILYGENFMTSSIGDFGTREAPISIQGRWVAEIAELAALNKADNLDAKKFITETVDRFRPVHGKHTVDRPRQCVIIGTTNDKTYLKDPTGNRRYWPVPCTKINFDGLAAARDQLWAEAFHRFRAGEHWWLENEQELRDASTAQSDRLEDDPWAAALDKVLAEPEMKLRGFVTTTGMLHSLNVTIDRQNKASEMRVAAHLAKRGMIKTKKRVDGFPQWIWQWPE